MDVQLDIFDLQGRKTCTIASGRFEPGWFDRTWDGRGPNGEAAGAGVYFVRFRAGGEHRIRRIVWTP